MHRTRSHRSGLSVLPLVCLVLAAHPLGAQGTPAAAGMPARAVEGAAELQVTDARLAAALEILVGASPTAAQALESLARSRLPVVIGTPAQLAALPESSGGLGATERRLLLASDDGGAHHAAVASVVFRAAGEAGAGAAEVAGEVERVWVAVEVDSVEAWIRGSGVRDAEARMRQDLLAILAHEFVAHVGSVAGSRRMEDLCDDPSPEQRRRSAEARARGEAPPLDGEMASCALRVENRVRRELNRALGLRGEMALAPRYSYALDVMHFDRARSGY